MTISVQLEYVPFSPQPDVPFTEESFVRKSVEYQFEPAEIGIALIDLWNFGWEEGPAGAGLLEEENFERGLSHALRKRAIIENTIAPTVNHLREKGIAIFHCNHPAFLEKYPQWFESTTDLERKELEGMWDGSLSTGAMDMSAKAPVYGWPPTEWVNEWREKHNRCVWGTSEWLNRQQVTVYPLMGIAPPVQPQDGDLTVFSQKQFDRLLRERQIKALFYMGFETDLCVQYSGYGLVNMSDHFQGYNYLCVIVRDATTTYETAESLPGLWKTRLAINSIEANFGYSITSTSLLMSVDDACNAS